AFFAMEPSSLRDTQHILEGKRGARKRLRRLQAVQPCACVTHSLKGIKEVTNLIARGGIRSKISQPRTVPPAAPGHESRGTVTAKHQIQRQSRTLRMGYAFEAESHLDGLGCAAELHSNESFFREARVFGQLAQHTL